MTPDLELVQIGRTESFKAWEHGYPFRTVRWHFHPEYEIHQVVETSGRCFIGDHIGSFQPGQLILTGPNLPHNWVSDVAPGEAVRLRSRVVQFSQAFIADAMAVLPELGACAPSLEASRSGALFPDATARAVEPLLAELVQTSGLRRVELFLCILGEMARAEGVRTLTSASYVPDPSGFMSSGINAALAFINDNLTEGFGEVDLARIARLSPGAFSRSFRRHTGMSLTAYVNRLRIALACQLLMGEERLPITEVCFASGFANVSNFNRQFLAQKGVTPSRFRTLLTRNVPADVA